MADGSWIDMTRPGIAAALDAARLAPTPAFVGILDRAGGDAPAPGHLTLAAVNEGCEAQVGVDGAIFAGRTREALFPSRGA